MFISTAVLLLAALFRLWQLGAVPPGLAQDEVLNADIVTFIRGGEHAFFFRHGFGHEPLYHYYAVPFQILFGDNLFSIRLPAVYLGMLLVAATMRWVRREFGWETAVLTGAFLAMSWWPIIFSRIGLRPIMLPLLLVGVVYFWKRPLLAGLLLGLSVYTYTAARLTLFIPIIFWLIQLLMTSVSNLGATRRHGDTAKNPPHPLTPSPHRPIAPSPHRPLLITLTALLIAAPMQITLWRDPSLQQRVNQLEGPLTALREGDWQPIWQSLTATLGVFSFTGDPRWTYMVPERPLFDPLTAVLFYAGLLIILLNLRQPRYLLALVWLGVGLLPSAITPQAPSTIRIIGALPIVYLMVGLGGAALWQSIRRLARSTSLLRGGTAVFLILLLLFNGVRTVQSGFMTWAQASQTHEKYQTAFWHISRHLANSHLESPPVLADAFFEPIDADTVIRNVGSDPEARWVEFSPNAGALVWPSGNPTVLYVPEFAPLPPELQRAVDLSADPRFRSTTNPSFAIYGLPSLQFEPLPEPLLFNDAMTLMGVEMRQIEGERPLELLTIWRVDGELPWDLTAFVHVLGDDPQPVTQHDGLDAAPTTLQPGDVILQRHTLMLPENLERPYDIHIGLYSGQSGQRWQISPNSATSYLYKESFIFDGNGHDE